MDTSDPVEDDATDDAGATAGAEQPTGEADTAPEAVDVPDAASDDGEEPAPESVVALASEAVAVEADDVSPMGFPLGVPAPDAFVEAVRAAETEAAPVSGAEEDEDTADDELDAPLRAIAASAGQRPSTPESKVTGSATSGADDGETGDAQDVRRFFDRRRPWLRPVTHRDRGRRTAGLFWILVYVLFMAGLTSTVSFVVVRGYLWLAPGPTNNGVRVARFVVPWVFSTAFVAFAFYVTRSIKRTLLYVLVFLLPYFTFLFIREASDAAAWLVKWVPGGLRVYGLTAFGPILALALLGRDFVAWQLWTEFPDDSCWACGARIQDERWAVCPMCGNDLETQRLEQAAAEHAGRVEPDAVEQKREAPEDEREASAMGSEEMPGEESAPVTTGGGERR